MAASQARYLALVARQSNCEYEGQQINQARLILSNQSANLFNQMLGLTVPVPPSTQDFTKTQYSFSDGTHSYVIDDWKQLPATDPDYNYIVNAHYNTDVYTGILRNMADPQVQISNISSGIASQAEIDAAVAQLRIAQEEMNSKYNNWQSVKSAQESMIGEIKNDAIYNVGRHVISVIHGAENPGTGVYTFQEEDNVYNITISQTNTDILGELKNMVDLGVITLENIREAMYAQDPTYYIADVSELEYNGELTATQQHVLESYGLSVNGSDRFIVRADEVVALYNTIHEGTSESGTFYGYKIAGDDFTTTDEYMADVLAHQQIIDNAKEAYDEAKAIYDERNNYYKSLGQPTYIGNAELTYLDTLTDEQEIELKQVVKDMLAQNINTDIINCFDTDGNYLGGVYSFDIYGTTYYTTYNNLLDAYASNQNSNNLIDAQYRMPYYNASYINTRVDQQGKALLETDGAGRFTTIRFQDDSATFALNMETITDDEAYQDAMNQYYYENAKYDKMVQDINAKTSIIHKEDQELELRLKQLDTERNALSNEIEAVQKVIKDNVEASFKTFGG